MVDRADWLPALSSPPAYPSQYETKLEPLVASAAVASGDQRQKDADSRHQATRQAQQQVWAFRRSIGELAHAGLFYENCFSRIRLQIAIEDDDGSRMPAWDDDGKPIIVDGYNPEDALAVLQQLRSPIGGQSALMRAMGGCLGLVGEGHLVGVDDDRMKSGKAWEFLSPSEFFQPATSVPNLSTGAAVEYHRVTTPGMPPTVLKSTDVVAIRVWQPDAEYSRLAWAPALGMLDIFDELLLLTREVAGAVRSRLAVGGLLLVADDIEYPPDPNRREGDKSDPFTADLIKFGSTAIKDKSSAAGPFPMVVRVPADRVGEGGVDGKQGFRLLEFARKWDDSAPAKRAECVQRFAQGIDLPPETVFGHMSTTFANAAQIAADQYRVYVEPKVLIGTDGLTTGYLRLQIPGCPFVIDPDPTDLVVRPDQIADWAEAHKRFVVSDSSYRSKLGATDADKPDDAELLRRVAIEQALRVRQSEQIQPGATPDERDLPASTGTGVEPDAVAQPDSIAAAAQAIVDGACEVEIRRTLQRIGARLRSKVANKSQYSSLIRNVVDEHVALTLGPRVVSTLMSETELLGREFDVLERWAVELVDAQSARAATDRARMELLQRLYNGARTTV